MLLTTVKNYCRENVPEHKVFSKAPLVYSNCFIKEEIYGKVKRFLSHIQNIGWKLPYSTTTGCANYSLLKLIWLLGCRRPITAGTAWRARRARAAASPSAPSRASPRPPPPPASPCPCTASPGGAATSSPRQVTTLNRQLNRAANETQIIDGVFTVTEKSPTIRAF